MRRELGHSIGVERGPEKDLIELIRRIEESHRSSIKDMAALLESPFGMAATTIRGLLGDWRRGLSLPVLLKKDRAQTFAEISRYQLTKQDLAVIEGYREWLESEKSTWKSQRKKRRRRLA